MNSDYEFILAWLTVSELHNSENISLLQTIIFLILRYVRMIIIGYCECLQ
jgi:hypothetical protein